MKIYNTKNECFNSILEASLTYKTTTSELLSVINKNIMLFDTIWFDKRGADQAYNEGHPIIDDFTYDKLFGINSSAYTLSEDTPWEKVKLPYPMASLDKIEVIDKDNEVFWTNLEKWFTEPVVASLKYDGLSNFLEYQNNALMGAYTRGKGNIGENILRNVVKVDNILFSLNYKTIEGLIGEIIFTKSVFKQEQQLIEKYDRARNAATGAVKDFTGNLAHLLTIRYHGIEIEDESIKTEVDKYKLMKNLGLNHIAYELCYTVEDVKRFYNLYKKSRPDLNVEIDGIVLKINDLEKQKQLGYSASGNPNFACALKFPHPQATTYLKNIEWSFGVTGRLTPVAIVEEVDLGANVNRASLHNLDIIKKLWQEDVPRIGDKINIIRSGEVIPEITKILEKNNGVKLQAPSICPICNSPTIIDGPFLECSNFDCDSRKLGDLTKWSNKIKEHFNCKGLAEKRIKQMFDAGLIKTPADFYRLTPEALISVLEGVKESAAANILSFQKHQIMPLEVFLGALNVPTIGQSIFEFIIKAGYDTLDKILSIKEEELVVIPNLSDIRAKLIVAGLKRKINLIADLLKYIRFEEIKKIESGKLIGKSFCFTGTMTESRTVLEKMVIVNGGEVKSGVSTKLTFLVAGDAAGSKLDKAIKLEVKVINEEEFKKML